MNNEHLLAKIGQYALIKNDQDKVLVLKRVRSKEWSLPGGRIHQNENWYDALVRELKEEIGVVIESVRPFDVHILTDPYQIKYCVYFEVKVKDIQNLELGSEHSDNQWISKNALDKANFEDEKIKNVIHKFLK